MNKDFLNWTAEMRTENGTYVRIGEVILIDGTELAVLKNYAMWSADVEMEDGSIENVRRNRITAI